jgi:hypothetical protein
MNHRVLRVLLSGAILLLMASTYAMADNVYATIRGSVSDQTGAVVQGATITATNTLTGVEYNTKSQDTGLFEFLQLPIGSYTVSIGKQGFKGYKSVGVNLTVNQVYDLPVKLSVGTQNETVEVHANAVQVETTDIQQKTVIGSNQIVDLPLIGRNFTQLEQLAPGVMASNDRFGTFSVNGSQTQQSSYLINGTDSNDIALNTPGLLPSPDAIQEFNLISSTINPEYGRNSGGIVNALIKSGTNSWHGNIFDFYRDTFLNTRNFFTVGPQQPIFHQNLFGGTFGGPIHKDKTFFFLSYQGTRNATGAPTLDTVFSAAQRAGNWSSGLGSATLNSTKTTPVPLIGDDGISYPAGTRWTCGGPKGTNPCGAFNVIFHQGTPNFGILPASNFNPLAVKLMNTFVPLPNAASNGFSFNPVSTVSADQGIARVDHTITTSDQIWGTAIFNHNLGTQGLPFTGATLAGFESHSTAETKEFTVAYNHTFNNTTLNEVRLGYWRLNFDAVEPNKPILPDSFGWTNITPQNPAAAGLPVVTVTGFFTLGFSSNGPQPRKDQNYQFTDNFSKVVGRHSFKFGVDARRFQVDNPFNFQNSGAFSFGAAGSRSSGSAGLDFLVGAPDSYSQNSGGAINARAYEYYVYAQDQWKVKNNLTLTYGAGYQIDTPYKNNQFGGLAYSCFVPGGQSTLFPTAPPGLLFPGDSSGNQNCTNAGTQTRYGHIGPRFGFAYSPHFGGRLTRGQENKTSIRGGFGIYFNRFEEETALQNLGTPPFGLGSAGNGDNGQRVSFANPWTNPTGTSTIPNKFPFTPPNPGDTTFDFGFFEPMSINTNSPTLSTPYAMNFNLNIQREFPGSTVLSVGYVGSLGRNLYRAYEGNPITAAGAAACKADVNCGSPLGNGPLLQHLLFPDHSAVDGSVFGSVGTQFTDGTSNYGALQVNVTKGMTHGLQLINSYTWSHCIDNGSGFENSGFGTRGTNVLNPQLNVGDCGQDARQRIVVGYVYAIPNLKKLLHWAPERVFGGWKMTGITTFQTGFPINISDSGFTSLTCDGLSFYGCPDNGNQVVGSVATLNARNSSFVSPLGGNTRANYFFDPTSFTKIPACTYAPVTFALQNGNVCGQYGNAGRNSLHGPGINNFDFSLQKDTKLTERTSFQMGIEAFNLFNHTQFGNPSGNLNSTNFGRITTAGSGRLVQLRAKFNF